MNKHGGYYGDKIKEVIDFSVNVNPLGPSQRLISELRSCMEDVVRYPEIDGKTCKKTLANYLKIDSDNIILGNGATELIYLFARALNPKKVLIVEPTFTEYRRAFKQSGSDINEIIAQEKYDFSIDINELIGKVYETKPHVVVMCNPNNPTGVFTNVRGIKPLLDTLKEIGSFLFVDESFIDFVLEEESYISLINHYPIFILRSMTKFFAIPGLRLGYGIGNKVLISILSSKKEPWTLNSLALRALPVVLDDKEYISKTLTWYKNEKEFLFNELQKLDFIKVFESSANFFLCELKGYDSKTLKDNLLKKNIYVRTCEDFIGIDDNYIRLAVKKHVENMRLIDELRNLKYREELCNEKKL